MTALLLAVATWAVLRPRDVVVVVHLPLQEVTAEGTESVNVDDMAFGRGEAQIVPSSEGVPARGTVSFGRGYGGIGSSSHDAPFRDLRVRAGSIVWACAGENPEGPQRCPPGMRFRTEAEAVIRPDPSDCGFSCNAYSDCVPMVAVEPGELGIVPRFHPVHTEATASDGLPVFASLCGEPPAGGSGTATARARRIADEQADADVAQRRGADVLVVRKRMETSGVEPRLTYPPTTVWVEVRISVGTVERAEIRRRAIAALTERVDADHELVARSVRVESEADADNLAVRYTASAKARPREDRLEARMAPLIAGKDRDTARQLLRERFGAVRVELPDGDLPAAERLDIEITSP